MTQYVVAHKPLTIPSYPDIQVIQVGFGPDFCVLRDNTKDNIAERNRNYCELTALYWIWRNDQHSEVVGINHYRRLFKEMNNPIRVNEILKTCDVIVPEFEPYRQTVREQYCLESGFEKDLKALGSLIEKMYGANDKKAFDEVMAQGGLYQYNMLIARKPVFDRYCAWLFPLLFELEKQVNLSGYNEYQKRIYGFLGERLFNVWIKASSLRVYEMKVVQTEMTFPKKCRLYLRRIRNRIAFQHSLKADRGKESIE